MIKNIHIENFRSISRADIPLGKITVLTGGNNSGKSSILYGLMVLQDFVNNPNQTLEELFALPFINLGGFEEVKSKNNTSNAVSGFIRLGIEATPEQHKDNFEYENSTFYNLALGHGRTFIDIQSKEGEFKFNAELAIGLPYSGKSNKQIVVTHLTQNSNQVLNWNGIISGLNPGLENDWMLKESINAPASALFSTDFIPIGRGFTKPYYNIVPMTGQLNTEDEIATMLRTENRSDLLGVINLYLEELIDLKLVVETNGIPGLFSLKMENTKTGKSNFLVNEGSGTNQLVTMFSRIFQYNKRVSCIDEPEVHLHPSLVKGLAGSFVDIAMELNHQFLVSTHSEHFVQALLENVASGKIAPEDICVYHLSLNNGNTVIERQEINDKGQISGGLIHFFADELSGLASIFKIGG